MELDYIEIGRNIRKYRLMQGLKQKELAEQVNLSDQHISHIESAHTKLSLPTLVAIANVLSVDCNTLLGETLVGARKELLHEELQTYLNNMDQSKLRLCVELCRVVAEQKDE